MNRYCIKHGVVPADHKCGRWANGGSTRAWRRTRARVLARDPYCTEPGCLDPATEVHHVTDHELRAVCRQHNPRGG